MEASELIKNMSNSIDDKLSIIDDKLSTLATILFHQDRCNYCYDHGWKYSSTCKQWMNTCFPTFIDEEEMEIQ
jgi:hypothetical protein